jgi:hypothetical protein
VSAVPGARKIEFIDAWARNFNTEYLAAKRGIEQIEEEQKSGAYASKGWWENARNAGYLYGTMAKFARPAASAMGWLGWPYKFWMLGTLAAARAAEVGAQVSRQRVATSVRDMSAPQVSETASGLRAIEATSAALGGAEEDAEARRDYESAAHEELPAEYQAAYDEAWQLYEEARAKSEGSGEKAKEEALDAVYASRLPEELRERIALGGEDQQRDWLAKRLQQKVTERIAGIAEEFNAAKTPEEKEALVQKHRATLEKYDSLIDSTGRVHVAAVRLDRLATAGKLAVIGVAAEAGVRGGWALAGAVRHWWENVEFVPSVGASHYTRADTTVLRPETREDVWRPIETPKAPATAAPATAAEAPHVATEAQARAALEEARAKDVATEEEAERAVAALREKHAPAPLPEREQGLVVKKGDSPLGLAKQLYIARAAELGYKGDVADSAALTRWAERASTRHIVGQWLVEHAEDSKEPLAKTFFEKEAHRALLARWKESGDRSALSELVRELRVRDFNDILKEKVPNLSLAGGRIEIDERGNISSFDQGGNRLLGHIAERGAGAGRVPIEEAAPLRRDVEILHEPRELESLMREADTEAGYRVFWEQRGFEKPAIARTAAEQAGITPQQLDQREELLLNFWGKHPEVIAHDSPREARHLFETLSQDPKVLRDQLSFLESYAYRRATLPEAKQVLRVADVLRERIAPTDIYRSVLAHFDAVRHVADTARQADILELYLSHGVNKPPLDRLMLGWNRDLFRGISASLDDNLDLRVRYTVRGNAVPVDLILYRTGRIAVDGHGGANWPAPHFRANALPLTEDNLREALAFLNRADGRGAVHIVDRVEEEGSSD